MHYGTHRDRLLIRHGERRGGAEGRSGEGILNAILGWTMGSVLLRSVHGIWTTGAS
jgi:hypothetical protein